MKDRTPRIAMLVKRLLVGVKNVEHAIQDQTEAIRTEGKQAWQENQPLPEIRAEIRLPKDVERYQGKQKKKEYSLQKANVIAAWLTFVVVAAYAGIAAWQLCEMRKATRAATCAANAARDSVTLARETAHLDQRAWVSVKSVKLTTPYSLSTNGQVTVAIANSGKTPALDAGITKAAFGHTDNINFIPIHGSPMTVAPQSTDDTFFVEVPAGNPSTKVYFRFVIEYRDIFQKASDRPHSTSFCGYYPTTQPPFFFNSSGCGTMN